MNEFAKEVAQAFVDAGFEMFEVGGAVRDEFMGQNPSDVDFATNASLEEAQAVVVPNATCVAIGADYEIVAFFRGGFDKVDVARFREEFGHTDDRKVFESRPVQTIEEDLARRDFTINAMARCMRSGRLVDPFAGRDDLSNNVLRCVGRAADRFDEDPLRVMRYFRFMARFNMEPDAEATQACVDMAERLRMVSAERVRDELFKILKVPNAQAVTRVFRLMQSTGVLAVVLPELSVLESLSFHPHYHSVDSFEHTMMVVEACPDHDLVTRLALLLHDVGKTAVCNPDGLTLGHARAGRDMVMEMAKRFRFTNEMRDEVAFLVDTHMDRMDDPSSMARKLKRAVANTTLNRAHAVRRADVVGRGDKADWTEATRLDDLFAELRAFASMKPALTVRDLAVNGQDLMAAGVKPGPTMGQTLNRMLSAVLDGQVDNDRDSLMAMV